MNWILLPAGILILATVALDIAYTTVSANRSGPVTHRVASGLWRLFKLVVRVSKRGKGLRFAGPFVMSGLALCWIAVTSIGWLLIFRSDPDGLVLKSGDAANWLQSYAFIGSALSTVGSSNVQAATAVWDNLAMIAAVNGMIVLTLSVTFVLNVTQTVAAGRSFSALIGVRDPADAANDDLLMPALADICTRLNATPLALYYTSLHQERSVPLSLKWLAERVSGDTLRARNYRQLLRELPYLETDPEADPDQFLSAINEWAARYTIDSR